MTYNEFSGTLNPTQSITGCLENKNGTRRQRLCTLHCSRLKLSFYLSLSLPSLSIVSLHMAMFSRHWKAYLFSCLDQRITGFFFISRYTNMHFVFRILTSKKGTKAYLRGVPTPNF